MHQTTLPHADQAKQTRSTTFINSVRVDNIMNDQVINIAFYVYRERAE